MKTEILVTSTAAMVGMEILVTEVAAAVVETEILVTGMEVEAAMEEMEILVTWMKVVTLATGTEMEAGPVREVNSSYK